MHEYHGIGRFAGIVQMPVDGAVKDYIKISYAGADTLYVPATQLDLVSKYIGAGEDRPVKLSKMGGTEWARTKTRAKAAAKSMAKELTALYAARSRTKGHASAPDSPWQTEFEEHFGYPETDDQLRCIDEIKALLDFLPSNNMEEAPVVESDDDPNREDESLNSVIPDDSSMPYDMLDVIKSCVDDGNVFQVLENYALNIITCFARFDGQTVGIIANQPKFLAGCLDINASDKAARFIRFCDSFNIPVVTFVDVPGFLPGTTQEYGGIIRHGAKMLYAYCEATVPKITVVTRKAYGGAYIAMCCRQLGADMVMAWPSAEIAVMGPDGAANIIFKHDPEKEKKKQEYINEFSTPYKAAEHGQIDCVIEPKETRPRIISALAMLYSKREERPSKKHGNMPL